MGVAGDPPTGVDVAVSLRRAQLRKQLTCDAALATLGMSLPQWGLLHAAAAEPGASTHALARHTGQSDQAAGALVVRLQDRGLLERRSGPGKALRHHVTAAGTDMAARCDAVVEQVMSRLLAPLTDDDRSALLAALDGLSAAALDVTTGTAGPGDGGTDPARFTP